MSEFAVFLRGVNVGGIKIKMADLAKALRDGGFAQVATVQAAGNVLVEGNSAGEVKSQVERLLSATFRYEAWVVVFGLAELEEIVAGCPYPTDSAEHHAYVLLSSDQQTLDEIARTDDLGEERFARGPGVLYWQVLVGKTLDGAFGKTIGSKRFKPYVTSRNVRTLRMMLRS
jgi:uncharacterized protein (DUF1697 family)